MLTPASDEELRNRYPHLWSNATGEPVSIFATAVRFIELTPAEDRAWRRRLVQQQVREARRAERKLYWDEGPPS